MRGWVGCAGVILASDRGVKRSVMPTIRDVAKRAGVAPITVSRVINNSGYVSAGTRARVEEAIEALQYVPNTLAQSFRFKRTNTLALVLSDITNPFWTTVTRGAEDAASEYDFNLILGNSDEDPQKLKRYIDLLLQRQVDGIMLVPVSTRPEELGVIERQNVPLVVLDRVIPGARVDTVRGDSEGGAFNATRYLIELGHRQIACLSGPEAISTGRQRVQGYVRALEEAGLPVEPALILYGEFNFKSGYERTRYLLATQERPTAWFAANNFIAVGVLRALYEQGVRVPEDAAVIGFDDLPPSMLINPFLTVVTQPAYELGYRAVEALLEHIQNPDTPAGRDIVLPTQMIVRQSCRPPAGAVGG